MKEESAKLYLWKRGKLLVNKLDSNTLKFLKFALKVQQKVSRTSSNDVCIVYELLKGDMKLGREMDVLSSQKPSKLLETFPNPLGFENML